MTWREFVAAIEAEIEREGGDPETIEVFYIDTDHYPEADKLGISVAEEGLSVAYG